MNKDEEITFHMIIAKTKEVNAQANLYIKKLKAFPLFTARLARLEVYQSLGDTH